MAVPLLRALVYFLSTPWHCSFAHHLRGSTEKGLNATGVNISNDHRIYIVYNFSRKALFKFHCSIVCYVQNQFNLLCSRCQDLVWDLSCTSWANNSRRNPHRTTAAAMAHWYTHRNSVIASHPHDTLCCISQTLVLSATRAPSFVSSSHHW